MAGFVEFHGGPHDGEHMVLADECYTEIRVALPVSLHEIVASPEEAVVEHRQGRYLNRWHLHEPDDTGRWYAEAHWETIVGP